MLYRFFCWPKTIHIPDQSAKTATREGILGYGIPLVITTESKLLGSKRACMRPYHATSKSVIMCCWVSSHWDDILSTVRLRLQKKPQKGSRRLLSWASSRSNSTVTWRKVRWRLDRRMWHPPFLEKIRQHMRKLQPSPISHRSSKTTFVRLHTSSSEWTPLKSHWHIHVCKSPLLNHCRR